jgi:hypothetical protein
MGEFQQLKELPPTTARCTLGVLLSPNGDGRTQINRTLMKAKEFLGKLLNASMSQWVKWVAVNALVEPSLLYPLVNTFYTESDIRLIEAILSQMRCAALRLNQCFVRALLHGPTRLGGLGITSPKHKVTR